MSYMIHSTGFGAIEDIADIATIEEAKEILHEKMQDFLDDNEVGDCDDWDEDENYFSCGISEEGYTSYMIYEVPDFKNKVEELMWKAKLALDDADDASRDYTYSLMDNCVDCYTLDARNCIDEALELLRKGGVIWK